MEARNMEAEKKKTNQPTNQVFRVEARHLRLRDEVVNEGQELNQQSLLLGCPRCQRGKKM